MTIVQHLISPATLPSPPSIVSSSSSSSSSSIDSSSIEEQLSILSYNILLPNSMDGWWTYKMYMPPLPKELQYQSSWEYRKDLLKKRIQLYNPDIICLQEVSPKSFTQDFDFLTSELGYDGIALFPKGRFRPATFWKTSTCQLMGDQPISKDRTLLTAFRLNTKEQQQQQQQQEEETVVVEEEEEEGRSSPSVPVPVPRRSTKKPARNWYVLNCHLQAGKNGPRRVRQIHEGIKAVRTLAKKQHDQDSETKLRLIVCGDFNGGSECGAVRFIEDGYIDSTFIEDGEPVSSKRKELPFQTPFIDVATTVDRKQQQQLTTDENENVKKEEEGQSSSSSSSPPPTLVVPELISTMVHDTTKDEDGDNTTAYGSHVRLSKDMIERLTRIYHRLAATSCDGSSSSSSSSDNNPSSSSSSMRMMTVSQVEDWLVTINGELGRGDEYREAARQMGWKEDDINKGRIIELPKYNDDDTGEKTPAVLPLDGFIEIYQKELQAGKFWGIAHDMAVLGEPLPNVGTFTARYDRMYYTSTSIEPIAVLDTISTKPCPNENEPSDHLPVAACFRVKHNKNK